MSSTDLALLVFRGVIGAVFRAHGLNHVFGGGRLRGTAEWFAGLGVRPGYAHAVLASGVEVVAGVPLVLGRPSGSVSPDGRGS
ncbi:DoxX family protein [Streptomyces levis]|uniref:DoxX family protein n=1 Tax=Streptomyces levis TaxID=285566 RepID=UPI003C7A381B